MERVDREVPAVRHAGWRPAWMSWRVTGPARVFVAFVLFSVLSASIGVGLLTVKVRDISNASTEAHATTDATLLARILQERIESYEFSARMQGRAQVLVQALASAVDAPSVATRAALHRELVLVTGRLPNLLTASVVDSEGRLVASSQPLTSPVGTDLSKHDWFTGVSAGDTFTSSAFSKSIRGQRITVTSARVMDAAGRRTGVLVLWGVSSLQNTIDQLTIDRTSQLFVVDGDDMVIAGSGIKDGRLLHVEDLRGLHAPFATRGSSVTRSDGYLVVRHPIAGASWSVLVRVRESAAGGTSDLVRRILIVTFIVGALGWMSLAYGVSRWIARTERHTARAAEAASARRKLGVIDEARARERSRIAEELHDTSLQLMNAAIMQLDTAHVLAQRADSGESVVERDRALDGTRSLLRDAIRGVRRILLGLAALDVDHLDLAEAIELASRRSADAGNVRLDVDISGVDDLVEPTRSIVYRLASELVSNAVRHSQAVRVGLSVTGDDRAVHVRVEDDGRGFERSVTTLEELPEAGGLGLRTLLRLHETGVVQARVESARGRGTTFDVVVPIDADDHAPND
ncbi:MAG: hypothetical protein H7287_08620 [Thermoleophilia bacterium]|nr:hypothetical protein [Thermoleophilia bacterium]